MMRVSTGSGSDRARPINLDCGRRLNPVAIAPGTDLITHDLRLQFGCADLTKRKHGPAKADGPTVILIDKEKTFERV
ncbi:MAG: hypothetical protein QOH70_751 [Blastocatellia bacterium]|nr:hypothetical protein [Blastocatellia bacterium]